MRIKYTAESLGAVVAQCTNICDVMRVLGLQQAGGNHAHVKKKIAEFEIDTSHFVKSGYYGGGIKRRTPEQVLVVRDFKDPLTKGRDLKVALLAQGHIYACALCGQGEVWEDKPLSLQVDHVNGKRWDNREENLRFLCPNCHSQSDNFSGRNIGRSIPTAEETSLDLV